MLDEATRALLAAAPVPAITASLYARGIRNSFLAGLTPLNPEQARFVGTAYTMRAIPAREDIRERTAKGELPHLHRQGIAAIQPGQVLVTDCGARSGISFFGEIITTHLAGRGISAIVTDAGIADTHAVAQIALPVFCLGSAPIPGPAQAMISDLDRPINCMGVPVYPGDILVGDREGVAVIPAHLATEIAKAATAKEALDAFLLTRIQSGAPLDGTYPPDAATLAAYEKGWRD